MYVITVRIGKNMIVRKSDTFTIGQGILYFKDTNKQDNIFNINDIDFLSIAKEIK